MTRATDSTRALVLQLLFMQPGMTVERLMLRTMKGRRTIEDALRELECEWLVQRHGGLWYIGVDSPPPVSESILRVLEAMGPDLPPREWAKRLNVREDAVRCAMAWLDFNTRRAA